VSKLIFCPDMDILPVVSMSEHSSCSDGSIWRSGFFIDENSHDLSNLIFVCETPPAGEFPDYVVTDRSCPIVSHRLKLLFDKLNINNIQYSPVTIVEREGEPTISGYYTANIIGLVDCINRSESEMDAEEDKNGDLNVIFSIDKLVLRDLPKDYGLLYRVFAFSSLLLIDYELANYFDSSNITGVNLVNPERWDGVYGEI